jgi:hypothetical protein
MSRRFWLTLLLIIHFLPWPGSQMLFSSIFTEPSGLSSAFGESDHTLIERFENGVIFSHSLPVSSEEFLVICEADSESLKSESEVENDHKSDFKYAFCDDLHNQHYSAIISTQICLYDQIWASMMLSPPFILRC